MGEMRPELYSRSRFRLQFRREHSFLWVRPTPRASQEAWRIVLTHPNAVKFAIPSLPLRHPRPTHRSEMGADDYVTIPFSPRALVDRLHMLMRSRSHVSPQSLHVFEGGTADFSHLIQESNPSEGAES